MSSLAPTELFPDPGLPLMQARDYEVRAYRRDDATMIVRGAVRDTLPAGWFDPNDPDPLVMHHMVVDLVIATETLTITDAVVVFESHPHTMCPTITEHYRNLIGLSIARGFTHKIRELFGGPRGCSHTTALLQAMAPVAMQAFLSRRIGEVRQMVGEDPAAFAAALASPEGRKRRVAGNINTCHVWAEGGEHLDKILGGTEVPIPIPIAQRLKKGDRG